MPTVTFPSRAEPTHGRRFDASRLALALACMLAALTTATILTVMPWNRHFATTRDYVVYWATGQQLVHHGNPYDPALMGRTEHAGGFDRTGSFYMRNPPWSLWLTLPLGYVNAQSAALPWSLLLLAILAGCVHTLWKMLGQPGSRLGWIGYCFPPALQCCLMGQTALFLLLGLVLFLRLHRTRPFWAGAALWFCTLKPHLFLPFATALVAWILVTSAWRLVAGFAAAMGASSLLMTWIDPAVWSQYLHWARTSGISHEPIPCLSVALRNLIRPDADWIVLLPAAAACVWALVFFWRHRHAWNWLEQGNLLMLISLVVAPYCWILDQSLALPAILSVLGGKPSRAALGALAAILLAMQLQPMLFSAGMNTVAYVWVAPAWLAWYWAGRRLSVG